MKAGLDYQKLIEIFSSQLPDDKRQDFAEPPVSPEATFIERVTVKKNGEVQISSWERLPDGVRACERYTYRPDRQDFKNLERTYGPLVPGSSKTIKKVLLDGKWVQV
jgi:hypothetical protein